MLRPAAPNRPPSPTPCGRAAGGAHRRRRTARGGLALALAALLLGAGPGAAPARGEDDLEPEPRWMFFAEPDEDAQRLLDGLIENSFADLNRVVPARDLLVRRFGAWSVPALERELRLAQNDSAVLNALLTVAPLRERLGPAPELLPLVRLLVERARDKESWRRAAALLALGAFHGPDGLGTPRAFRDRTLVSDPVEEARRLWPDALALLAQGLSDPNMPVRVAAALALGKTGGSAAREQLLRAPREGGVASRMSFHLALGLLPEREAYDQDVFVRGLEHEQTEVRASAALGAALQAVGGAPPAWLETPDALLRAFAAPALVTGKSDTAEAVFARGCLAAHHQRRPEEWEVVFAAAVAPRVESAVAVAAAQVLVWCEEPGVRGRALAQLASSRRSLHDAVLAGFLLRAGSDGTLEGVRQCREWLGSASLSPAAERDWDVRWHAALGLLRAFRDGRLAGAEARRAAVEALDAAVERGLARDCALLPALSAFLARHRDRLLASPEHRPGEEEVRDLEALAPCRHGLLAASLAESAVGRANALLAEVLGLTGLPAATAATKDKDKEGNSRRFFERCLSAWPYLTRRDVLPERGRRPPQALRFDDALKVLDR